MEAPILRWSQRSFKNHSLVSENGGVGFLFRGEAASSLPSQGERLCVEKTGILVSQPSPLGKGDRVSGG